MSGEPGALVEQAETLRACEEFGGLPDVGDGGGGGDLLVAGAGVGGEVGRPWRAIPAPSGSRRA